MAMPLIYLLMAVIVGLATLAVTVYEHVTSSTLSLPLSPVLTALTIILPILASINALCLLLFRARTASPTSLPLSQLLLQGLQGVLTIILATLLATNLTPTPGPCLLAETWQRLYSAHDAPALRRIQDALDCCGFNSVVDRAWPFPTPGRPSVCPGSFGRTESCRDRWTGALRTSAGVELAIAIIVGLFQICSFLLVRWGGTQWHRTSATQYFSGVGPRDRHTVTRPLLAGGGEHSDDDTEQQQRERNGYGSGPRVEPTPTGDGGNAWSEE